MKAICPEICTFIHHISVYFESLGTFTVMKSLYNLPVLRNSRNLNKSSYKSSKNPKNSEKIRVQSVGCVYSHRTECRQIMCSRLVNRFSSSYSVEITSKQGPAKFWRWFWNLRSPFFATISINRNQPTQTKPSNPKQPPQLIDPNQLNLANPYQLIQLKLIKLIVFTEDFSLLRRFSLLKIYTVRDF